MCDFLSPAPWLPGKAGGGGSGRQGPDGVGEGQGWVCGIPEFAIPIRDRATGDMVVPRIWPQPLATSFLLGHGGWTWNQKGLLPAVMVTLKAMNPPGPPTGGGPCSGELSHSLFPSIHSLPPTDTSSVLPPVPPRRACGDRQTSFSAVEKPGEKANNGLSITRETSTGRKDRSLGPPRSV